MGCSVSSQAELELFVGVETEALGRGSNSKNLEHIAAFWSVVILILSLLPFQENVLTVGAENQARGGLTGVMVVYFQESFRECSQLKRAGVYSIFPGLLCCAHPVFKSVSDSLL